MDAKDLQWVVKVAEGVIGTALPHLRDIYIAGSVGSWKDPTHPGHSLHPQLLVTGVCITTRQARLRTLQKTYTHTIYRSIYPKIPPHWY